MTSFILRKLDPEFWQRVRAKADAEGTTVKAVILKLLTAWLAAVIVLSVSACSGDSPTTPSSTAPPIVPPAPVTVTLTGHVTATNGGQPLSGLQTLLTGQSTTTDGTGTFRYSLAPSAFNARLELSGSGIVPRSLMVAIGTRDINISAIGTAGFDVNFYRQLVRNGFDAPGALQPLRRWTVAPSIYLKTIDEAGTAIDAQTLNATEGAAIDAVARWTVGSFSVVRVERGTDTRVGVAGWLTMRWSADAASHCGLAQVGVSGGWIDLYYKNPNCRCPGVSEIRPRTVKHEIGHAMGFWHSDAPSDLMYGVGIGGCDANPSARELAAAAIAYQRPVGNVDPDSDPIGTVTLRAIAVQE